MKQLKIFTISFLTFLSVESIGQTSEWNFGKPNKWITYQGGVSKIIDGKTKISFNNKTYMAYTFPAGQRIDTRQIVGIVIKFKNNTSAVSARFHWKNGDKYAYVDFSIKPYDTAATEYAIDLSKNKKWQSVEDLTQIRFDFNGAGDNQDVDIIYISLKKRVD